MLNVFLNERGLQLPPGLSDIYASPEARSLDSYIYWPDKDEADCNSLGWALRLLRDATTPPPNNYLPLLPVDEMSIACVVCNPVDDSNDVTSVVRWHIGNLQPNSRIVYWILMLASTCVLLLKNCELEIPVSNA